MRIPITSLLIVVALFPAVASATDVEGDVWGTWTKENSPYNVIGEVTVPPGSTLVIEPGVLVDFEGLHKFIVDTSATLLAVGTETDSIYFTSHEPPVGWQGIRFIGASDSSRLSYCLLEYARAVGSNQDRYGGALYFAHSSPTVTNCTVARNKASKRGAGLYCHKSNPTITDNVITDNSTGEGGGIYCYYSSPIISGNMITENKANPVGGGIYCDNSDPIITGNTITDNLADWGGVGGGIYCQNSDATITFNTISNNWAYWGGYGGGIDLCAGSSALIRGNTISGNRAREGGGIFCADSDPDIVDNTIDQNRGYHGAGINCGSSSATISNKAVSRNRSGRHGGGLYCGSSSPTINNNSIVGNSAASCGGGLCLVASNPVVMGNNICWNSASGHGGGVHCDWGRPQMSYNVISNNSAELFGGGISFYYYSGGTVSNTTITGNYADSSGGAICLRNISSVTITNSVLWADESTIGREIYVDPSSSVDLTYCDVQGGWPGTGNIDANPIFVGPERSDLHLRWRSPCIDAGDPSFPLDPDGTRSDIGAFYFNQDVHGIVELYPYNTPIIIPPEGGDIIYDGWVFNFFGRPGRADIWTYAFVPEVGRYGPINLYENIRIPPDTLGMNEISQHVPGIGPQGDYVFVVYVGEYPTTVIDSSYFYFAKTGSIPGGTDAWFGSNAWFNHITLTEGNLPSHYHLSQNYPNPFNATTAINYHLPVDGHVKLEVYNVLGEKAATLVEEKQKAGYKSVIWDASELSSGLYFYKLTVGDFTETKRMMLVK